MIKKLLSAILLAVTPICALGQLAIGSWTVHKPYYNVRLYQANYAADRFVGHQMIETPDIVYYVSLGNLFSYDKKNQETYTYSSTNKLSDNEVNGLWYNYDKKYLIIAYSTGNIDILYDDGTINNLPDIGDAVMTSGKTIYDVAFDGDIAYVATNFGLVKFNIPGRYVIDSGNYNFAITGVCVFDNHLVVNSGKDRLSYLIGKNERLNSFDKFKSTTWKDGWRSNMYKIDANRMLFRFQDGTPYIMKLKFDNLSSDIGVPINGIPALDCIVPTSDGKWMGCTVDGTKLYEISADGSFTTYNIPETMVGNKSTYWESPKKVWSANAKGVANVDVTTTPATLLSDYATPSKFNIRRVGNFVNAKDGSVYMNQLDLSHTMGFGFSYHESPINRYFNEEFDNVSLSEMNDSRFGPITYYFDALDVCPDPFDENTYYLATLWEGVIRVQRQSDGTWKETSIYNPSNSPLIAVGDFWPGTAVAVDNVGNLWVTPYFESATAGPSNIMMLPASKRKNNTVSKSDWHAIKVNGFMPSFDTRILVCKSANNANLVMFMDSAWPTNVVVYDNNGTESTSDDKYNMISSFVDQDGKTFDTRRLFDMKEDNNGKIWFATYSGLLELSNPRNALSQNVTFNRLKVPRNDGSGLADYLLDAVEVYSIAVDGANNKWLGTKTGGLYYVSGTGDQVLDQFTMDNSPILSNTVYAVGCVPGSNRVLVSTDYGVMEYSSTTAPAEESFDNVYAYPNPVRPEYTGWITIKGLMDNSQVKIADAYGNVFYNGVSEGGMIIWDGCNRDGKRVSSGVYYVYASQSGEGMSTQGAVTKILVIN